ncbi:oxidoreductase [Mycena epipterygia]|nr:oxidoreductase [Mycena epipterygia]
MPFNLTTDIPELSDKVIFISGGTAGLGKQSILALAKKNPAHIYFSGRDADRAAALITQVTTSVPSAHLTFVKCNMSSLANVAEAAKELASKTERLDIMMCNAGVFSTPPALTEDGYETIFGINHLAHALLIKLLLPTLLHTPDSRVVILSSEGFRGATFGIQLEKMRTTQSGFSETMQRYPQSKLANLLYAAELARRYPQLTTVSLHPGTVGTDMLLTAGRLDRLVVKIFSIWNGELIFTPEEGVLNQLWAATVNKSDLRLVNGEYYTPVGVRGKHTKRSTDGKLAGELWEWTEKELEGYPASR